MKTPPRQLEIRKGQLVQCGGQEYAITNVIALDKVLAKNLKTGDLESLSIAHLTPPAGNMPEDKGRETDLEDVSAEDWNKAKDRLEIIKPLLMPRKHGDSAAKQIAEKNGLSVPTLYNWRRLYLSSGLLSSLLPTRPNGGAKKSRLKDKGVEKIVDDTIQNYYLTDEHPSVVATLKKIQEQCTEGMKAPHISTLRKHIFWLSGRERAAGRQGEYRASMQFDVNEGKIPDADWPLAMVQMDHTELPVMIVDEEYRRPICRPWVTFAIDVNSRMVPGMYLTLDHPSALSAGMCLSHAILPKESWLTERGIEAEWPCWGVMGSLHMDNAREFRGNMLRAACEEYLIDLHLRPVKKPHYGAHIERLMGTVSEELKTIPGATFSGPEEKGEYDSEGNAIMTLAELERWLAYFLARYHHRLHSGIGMSPFEKYREGLLGTRGKPGRGLPARRLDEEKLRIDFMPFEERTIQDYGVVIDDVHYFADVLRPWVNATDQDNPRAKRLFRFRRDPRDISRLFFFDLIAQRYFPIPYRDLSLPPISLWEMREAKKTAKADGHKNVDERTIFEYTRRMREEVAQAAGKTKAARKRQQKVAEHAKSRTQRKKELPKTLQAPAPSAPPPVVEGYDPDSVTPFEED